MDDAVTAMRKLLLIAALLLAALPAHADRDQVAMMQMIVGDGPQHGGASCALPLDSGCTWTAALGVSFRCLKTSYCTSGKAVRLRGTGTQDIGFASGNFDTASAATFCTGACTIAGWFNQVDGSFITVISSDEFNYLASCQNSQPCGTASGNNTRYSATLGSAVGVNTANYVVKFLTSDNQTAIQIGNSGANVNGTRYIRGQGSGNAQAQRGDNSTTGNAFLSDAANAFKIYIGTNSNTLSRIFVNGTQGTDDASSITITTSTTLSLGNEYDSAFSALGGMAEAIVWSPNISDANAKLVCVNQGTYWGVTTTC